MPYECNACGHQQSWRESTTYTCDDCGTGELVPVGELPGPTPSP